MFRPLMLPIFRVAVETCKGKGKAILLHASSVPDGSSKLSSADYRQRHRMVVRLSALSTGRLYTQQKSLELISVRG